MGIKRSLMVLGVLGSLVMNIYGDPSGKNIDQLFRQSIVIPVKYENKMYIKGSYYEDNSAYKIEKVDGEYYIPVRLWGALINNNFCDDWWQMVIGTTEPMQIDFVSWKGRRDGGGWTNTNEIGMTLKFTVGSKKVLKNKEEVILARAPQKIKGQVFLPMSAIEELFELEVSEQSDLLFIGKDEVKVDNKQDEVVINQITEALKSGKKKGVETKTFDKTMYVDGKTYYITNEKLPKLEDWKMHLWVRTGDGKVREIKLPENTKIGWESSHLNTERLYYTATKGADTYLYALDLKTEQSKELANLTQKAYWKQDDWGWLGPIYEANGRLYITLHMGDYTMGGEALYEASKGEVKELVSAKFFSDIEFVDDKLYYTDAENFGGLNNLYELDLGTLKKRKVGTDDYEYHKVIYRDNALYVLAKKYQKDSEVYQDQCLYRIDLESGEHKKLTLHTDQYWIEDRVYYIDESTQYLIGIDLDGQNKKTILAKPIRKIEKQGSKFYYLLDGYVPGIFKYDLTTGQVQTVMTQYTDSMVVLADTVLGISRGYNPGIFKVESGKTVQKVKGIVDQSIFNTNNMLYMLYGEDKINFIR